MGIKEEVMKEIEKRYREELDIRDETKVWWTLMLDESIDLTLEKVEKLIEETRRKLIIPVKSNDQQVNGINLLASYLRDSFISGSVKSEDK